MRPPKRWRVWVAAVALAAMAQTPAAAAGVAQAKRAAAAGNFPRAEQLLQRRLRRRPSDQAARFLLARVLSWQRKWDAALVQYDRLIKAAPRNADYLLGKAQTLVWRGAPRQALPLLVSAKKRAPRYLAVWRLQIQALAAIGEPAARRRALRLQRQAAARFPDARWNLVPPLAPKPAPPAPSPQRATPRPSPRNAAIEAGVGYKNLDSGYEDWRSAYLSGSRKWPDGRVLYGSLRETVRFSLKDNEATVGEYRPLGKNWRLVVEGGGSPTHRVLARWSLLGQVQRNFPGGWDVQGGLRHTEYNDAASNKTILTMERYWGNYQAAYTFSSSRLQHAATGSAPSHRFQGNYFYGDRSHVGLAYSTGREIETITPSVVRSADVWSWSLTGRQALGRDWSFSYVLSLHEQGDSYTREDVRLGLRRAF